MSQLWKASIVTMVVTLGCKAPYLGPANVVVDLGTPRSVPSMTGFLNGPNGGTDAELLRSLAPRLLRGDSSRILVDPTEEDQTQRWARAQLALFHDVGARRVFTLDTTWGHPSTEWSFPDGTPKWLCAWCNPNDPNGPPWDETHAGGFSKWRDHVVEVTMQLVQEIEDYNDANPDAPIDLVEEFIFDVWNEPNNDVFWVRDMYNEYYETYCVAENAVRSIIPDARVTGPSFASYYVEQIEGLLDFCRGEVDPTYEVTSGCSSCRVDVLNWHANLADPAEINPDDPPYAFEDVRDSVEYARTQWMESSTYEELEIEELLFLEHTGQDDYHRPGEAVRYLQVFEDSGVDGVARSCWEWPDEDVNECFDGTVGGLFNATGTEEDPDWEKRAIAGVYLTYPAGVPSRVTSSTSDAALSVLASRQGSESDTVEILVGHSRQIGVEHGEPIEVIIELQNLDAVDVLEGASQLEVEVLHLPYECVPDLPGFPCGREPLEEPETTTVQVDVRNGSAAFATRALAIHEAMIVRIRP